MKCCINFYYPINGPHTCQMNCFFKGLENLHNLSQYMALLITAI